MIIRVDPAASVPVFQQIVDEVKSAVARGACAPGEPIPSVRQMASQTLVNPNTVAKAYRDLEREGILYTRKGIGVFVSDDALKHCRNGRRDDIRDKVAELVAEARRAGIADDELRKTLDQFMRETRTAAKSEGGASR